MLCDLHVVPFKHVLTSNNALKWKKLDSSEKTNFLITMSNLIYLFIFSIIYAIIAAENGF